MQSPSSGTPSTRSSVPRPIRTGGGAAAVPRGRCRLGVAGGDPPPPLQDGGSARGERRAPPPAPSRCGSAPGPFVSPGCTGPRDALARAARSAPGSRGARHLRRRAEAQPPRGRPSRCGRGAGPLFISSLQAGRSMFRDTAGRCDTWRCDSLFSAPTAGPSSPHPSAISPWEGRPALAWQVLTVAGWISSSLPGGIQSGTSASTARAGATRTPAQQVHLSPCARFQRFPVTQRWRKVRFTPARAAPARASRARRLPHAAGSSAQQVCLLLRVLLRRGLDVRGGGRPVALVVAACL